MAPLSVASIEPSSLVNDQPARITVFGNGFVDPSYTVTVGGHPLTDVRVESATAITGTLSAGACPGAYTATVTDAHGSTTSGGSVTTHGVLSATTLNGEPAPPPIGLASRLQQAVITLPTVQIHDTTCGSGDLHLQVSVNDFSLSRERSPRLVPLVVTAQGDGWTVSQPLAASSENHTATLPIRRPDHSGLATIALSTQIEIPTHPAAGDYRTTVTVDLQEETSP